MHSVTLPPACPDETFLRETDVRVIAFYLPQYHPVPENDQWWGKGFTEWSSVVRAKPLFPGHYQPHLPADMGFYDLRLPEARQQQAALAKASGISGFCYYHYWFNGRRILERPFEAVLASGEPDLPFCLCWANENWTRRWSGAENEVLLHQEYSDEDDKQHFLSLLPAFRDPRYIRIEGKPLFLVYRTELLPDPGRTAATWRSLARRHGLGEIYLARVESFAAGIVPASIGFDAAVEFAPDWRLLRRGSRRSISEAVLGALGAASKTFSIYDYAAFAARMTRKPDPPYRLIKCAMPSWDNSARRIGGKALVFDGCSPSAYERWLRELICRERQESDPAHRMVFINAWNEWSEGCHLEPDARHGAAFLESTLRALQ